MPDDQLVTALHTKYYSDIPVEQFTQKIGFQSAQPLTPEQPIEQQPIQQQEVDGFTGAAMKAPEDKSMLELVGDKLENWGAGLGERAGDLGGALLQTIQTTGEGLEQKLPMGGFVWEDGDIIPSYKSPDEWAITEAEPILTKGADVLKGVDLGYEEQANWEGVKKAFSEGGPLSGSAYAEVLEYGLEQGIKSVPDMVATIYALPAYIFARSGEIGEQRAINKGKDKAELEDILEAAPFAAASALLERIGAKGMTSDAKAELGTELLKAGIKEQTKRVAKAGGKALSKEAATEAVQEGMIEYVGERYGTDAKMDFMEALDRAAAGAVAGGVFGGTIGTGTATVNEINYSPEKVIAQAMEEELASKDIAVDETAIDLLDPERAQLEKTDTQEKFEASELWQNLTKEEQAKFKEVLNDVETEAKPELEVDIKEQAIDKAKMPEQEAVEVELPKEPESEKPVKQQVTGLEVVEAPISEIKISEDVPQFKEGADIKGVVEPLGGKFERTGVAPIQIWVRKNGDKEVISGRHRLDLAERSGEKTIPAQYHYESKGFGVDQAAALDAVLNIREGQGKVKDYVDFIKATKPRKQEAESQGLLARQTGKRAFSIATEGSDALVTAHRNDQVTDEAATRIAEAAPRNESLQAVGIKAIQEGKTITVAENLVKAVKSMTSDQQQSSGDLFGFDDSAMIEAEKLAKAASKKQSEIQKTLSAVQGAAKRPELAAKEGVDVKNPEAVKARIEELKNQKRDWSNWHTNPALVAELKGKGFELKAETETERQQREAIEAKAAKDKQSEEQAEIDKAEVDKQVDDFDLTGSDRSADVAMAAGQGDLLSQANEKQQHTKTVKRKSFNWDSVELSKNYTAKELDQWIKELTSDPSNKNLSGGIDLYNKATMKKIDKLSTAVMFLQKQGKEASEVSEVEAERIKQKEAKEADNKKKPKLSEVVKEASDETLTDADKVPETLKSASGKAGPLNIQTLSNIGFPTKEVGERISIGGGFHITIGKKPVSTRRVRTLMGKISKGLLYYGKSVTVKGTTKGIYSLNGEFVQTAEKETSEAVEVLTHELFHYIDEKRIYGDELVNFSKNAAKGYTYNENAPYQEDGAEFFRIYMTDYPTLKRQSPDAVILLEDILKTNKVLYRKIKQIQKATHEYLHQPVELRGDSYKHKEMGIVKRFIMEGELQRTIRSFFSLNTKGGRAEVADIPRRITQEISEGTISLVKKTFNSVLDNRVGALSAAKGVDNSDALMELTNLPHHIYQFVTETINGGVPSFESGQIIFDDRSTKGFAKALDSLGKDKGKKLFNYLDGRRAKDLREQGKEKLHDDDVIDLYVSYGNDPEIKKVADHYDRLMDGLKELAIKEGALTQEAADAMGNNYVNFGRSIEHIGSIEGAGSKDPYKAIHGGSQLLKEAEERLISSITGSLTATINARIKRALYSKPNAEYFVPWDKQMEPSTLNIDQAVSMIVELHDQGISVLSDDFIIKGKDGKGVLDIEAIENLLKNNPSLITSFVAVDPSNTEFDIDSWIDETGKERFVATPKGGVFSVSMNNIGKMNRTTIGRIASPLKAIYSHYMIMAMPYIQIPNLIADYVNYPLLTREYKARQAYRAYMDLGAMAIRALVNTKSIQKYSAMGIFDTTMNSKLFDHMNVAPKIQIKGKGTLNPERLLMRLSSVTKFLEYERSIKNGKSPKEAAYNANKMTAEWGMRGHSLFINTLLDIVPFARSVSNSVFREVQRFNESTETTGKTTAKMIARNLISLHIKGGMTLGLFGTIMYIYMTEDEERKKLWDEATPEQRMRSVYMAATGEDDYSVMANKVKIPFMYGSYFMGAAWGIMDSIRGVDKRKPLQEFAIRFARNFVMPVDVPVVTPLIQVGLNVNFYNLSPIEPEYMRKLPIELRRTAFTPEFIQSDDSSTFSAKQKEFLYRRSGGAIGSMIMDIVSSETWDYKAYGDKPFSIYRPDNKMGGLYHLSTSKAYENIVNNRETVYTRSFEKLTEKIFQDKAKAKKIVRDFEVKGKGELSDIIKFKVETDISKAVNEYSNLLGEDSYKIASDEQRVIKGMYLTQRAHNAMRRITYGNIKPYGNMFTGGKPNINKGYLADIITINTVLKTFGGKKISTTFGTVTIPKDYSEYAKKPKDGGYKEALIWSIQRYKNDQIKKLIQSKDG